MNAALVGRQDELAALCARVAASRRVGLDTEFHQEKSYAARLMVVQLAFEDGVTIVDPLAVRDLSPLARALGETTVVGHALTSDLKIFADRWDMLPGGAFDTQVAAAFCGYGMAVSLLDLVRDVTGVTLRKSQTVSDWSLRPFSEKQLEYLVDDVAHLFALQDRLSERLSERGRLEWAREECRELLKPDRYRADPERLYLRLPGSTRMNRRELGILRELARLRDRIARERDVPPKYVIADDVVVGVAHLRPKRAADLGQLRRLDNGTKKNFGDVLLEAVALGEALPDAELPQKPARGLSAIAEGLVALMSVLVGSIAAENDLPPALLAPRAALERVARNVPVEHDDFVAALRLTPWRVEIVGEPLWRLLTGRLALGIEGYPAAPRTVVRTF